MPDNGAFTVKVGEGDAGVRLDTVVANHVPDCSRSLAATLIKDGIVRVDGEIKKSGYRLKPGEIISGHIPAKAPAGFHPQPVPIHVLYEDDHLMVLDKPAGLVVHPAPGHPSATLVNGILFHCPDIEGIGGKARPGIVHRLDKDTSGVLIVAKKSTTHEHLSDQFKNRRIKKNYLAIVWGRVEPLSGRIDFSIGRDPRERKKMSIHSPRARRSETLWRVKERYSDTTLLHLDIKTGRTHQIRVHCAAIGYPVMGDTVYNKKNRPFVTTPDGTSVLIPRQMLHAWRIGFEHPADGRPMRFEAPIPEDMTRIIGYLKLPK